MVSRYVQPAVVTTAGVVVAAFGGSVVAGAVAFATWPLLEYVTHRWLLHAPRGWASRAHRKHHKAPRDPKYLLVPFRVVFAASCVLALPAAVFTWWLSWLGVTLVAYGFFEALHMAAHAYPRAWFAVRHSAHHRYQVTDFGVTTGVVDRAFGTASPANPVRLYSGE